MRKWRTSMLVFLSGASPVLAQSPADPGVLVARLADAAECAAARKQLLALGAGALPAITAALPTAGESVARELLGILIELGPKAGAAVPYVRALLEGKGNLASEAVATLAELAPWGDVTFDPDELSQAQMRMTMRNRRGTTSTGDALSFQRLQERTAFPRDANLETLLQLASGRKLLRVEIAIEHLGQRGAGAAAALPRLREVLERPEPRILTTEGTLPLHRKAARAVLAIAPEGELAALARDVLSGKRPPPTLAPRPVPERVQKRVDELVAELALPAKRAAAMANLVALGELSTLPVAGVLAGGGEAETIDAALAVLRDLGERGAAAVPHLIDAALAAEHTVAVLQTLEVTAPWATDLMPPMTSSGGVGHFSIFGRPIRGTIDAAFLTAVMAEQVRLHAALQVDPSAPLPELETLLQDRSVQVREFALAAVVGRGVAARPLLPALATMLDASQPLLYRITWVNAQGARNDQVDRTPIVHRLAARAIVAAAAPDDPLLARARAVLAEPEPK